MRLQALTVAAQVVAALMLLGISLVAISVLEKADDVLASASVQRADRPAIADARQATGGAVGLIAIVAGSGLLALLLFGAWIGRRVVGPLTRLERTVGSIAEGHLQRRVDDAAGLGEVNSLAANVNRIVDQLRHFQRVRLSDNLLARAALEHLLDEGGRGGAVLDTVGRLVASNAAVREALDAGGCDAGALLGRDASAPALGATISEVREGGVLRGYVARV
ncbi:MAG: HAMP domain-containing protein [Planctomycetes bacterium]|jgi:HAMP domain-containing protein|nr:HAMP domain-containing protein [Planctomycetota bacterium]